MRMKNRMPGLLDLLRISAGECIFTFILISITFWSAGTVNAEEPAWPRKIDAPEVKIILYQPQLESFKDDKLKARAAVSVTKKGETEPLFGVIWFTSRVSTDRDARMVTILDAKVTDVKFPEGPPPDKLEKFKQILESDVPKGDLSISLDRLLAMLDLVEKEKASADDLKATPPKIIHVTHPAVLVTIDGEPELSKVKNSKLMRIVNTPFFIVFDPEKKNYYLKGGNEWLRTKDIMGAWQSEPGPPASVVAAAESFNDKQDESGEKQDTGSMPQIIVATAPTELIVSEGEPKYKSVTGTGLLYMSNTESDVFMEISSQKYFVLLSGRWFKSASMDGPWSYVPSDKLPSDFAKIPQGSDKGSVLANVTGTEQAREAVLDTYIPQTTAIKREEATVKVEYDGKPEFVVIDGTVMSYAVNTPHSIIRIGNKYYLCHEAVWYISDRPSGPWAIAVNIPKEIYTIPPSYPVYHVKYVYVYDYTPTVVYVGYTPGYTGTYVYGGTVVYGTGYYYRGWYRTVYYARPVTWGYSVHYSSVSGRWGVRVGYAAPGVWYSGRAVWGVGGIARRAYWRNEYEDRRDWRRDRHEDRRDSQRDRYADRRDRDRDRGGRDRDRPDSPGDKPDKPGDRPDKPGAKPDKPGAKPDRSSTRERKTGTDKKRQNNVFADRNGNVHRKTDKGWQQKDKSGWSKPDKSRSGSGSSNLNRDYKARDRGSQRTRDFERSRSSSRSRGSGMSRSGGGRRGGGGGRRR
jgi:uncharacterized membrane protein YgcG